MINISKEYIKVSLSTSSKITSDKIKRILFLARPSDGMPASLEDKRVLECASIEAVTEAGVATDSNLYSACEAWFNTRQNPIFLGFVGETEEFDDALNIIKNYNDKWYGILPLCIENSPRTPTGEDAELTAKELTHQNLKKVAQFAYSNCRLAFLLSNDEDILSQGIDTDIASELKSLKLSGSGIFYDKQFAENKYKFVGASAALLLDSTPGDFTLAWKQLSNIVIGDYKEGEKTALKNKNVNFFDETDIDNVSIVMEGKSIYNKRGLGVQRDLDYGKMLIQTELSSLFLNKNKIGNDVAGQSVIQYAIIAAMSTLINLGVFQTCTKAQIAASRYISEDDVEGYMDAYGFALEMPDITNSDNVLNDIYKGLKIWTKTVNEVLGVDLSIFAEE